MDHSRWVTTALFISQDPRRRDWSIIRVEILPSRLELRSKVNTSTQGQILILSSAHQRLLIHTNYLTSPISFLEHRYEHEVHHSDHSCGLRCPLHCSRSFCHSRQLAELRCKFSDTHYVVLLLTNAVETMRQHSPRPMQSRCPVYLLGPGLHHEHFLLHRDIMLAIRPTTWVFLTLQILLQTH